MKSTIIILLLISPISVYGQNHFIGLKGGINWTNINSTDFLSNNDNRTGFNGGVTYELRLKKNFNFGVDLLYTQKGFTNDIIFTNETGNPTGEKATIVFNYDYLTIPVKGGFLIGKRISGFVNLGIVPSLLIDAKTITPAFDNIIEEETFDVTNRVTKFDFGGMIEIGGNYKFKKRFLLYTSYAYQHSFTTITNSDYFAIGKSKTLRYDIVDWTKIRIKKRIKGRMMVLILFIL